ncbi:hypothetical protein BFF78_17280 [Streptomyces fodineus]|uniref:Uncharacterized protein n=1 Tax=Streptomyces fodineus TaxID=1904616 RepID=A0A1D7YAH4_9ACTN|nr:hypothetical protein [Streptomyces fodineus]AOR32581.1 hypothetical protein BFF78_17280 [Streptomyces fodineus]
MPESRPAGVSMRDLLAACAAAQAVSSPPGDPEERPDGAQGRVEPAATAARARPATTHPQPDDGPSQHPHAA